MMNDLGLISKRSKLCKLADFDRVFIAVDAASARRAKEQERAAGSGSNQQSTSQGHSTASSSHQPNYSRSRSSHDRPGRRGGDGRPAGGAPPMDDQLKRLNRVEFIVALVHIAANKFVRTGLLTDMSEAVSRLIEVHMQSHMPGPSAPADVFRRQVAYREDVSRALAAEEKTLRSLFGAIADSGDASRTDKLTYQLVSSERSMISVGEWLAFLRQAHLLGVDLTERDAKLAFIFSRMCTVEGHSVRGYLREVNLPFEGFMEALCHAATLKAWPTPAEISQAGCADIGEYMDNGGLTAEQVAALATPWGRESPTLAASNVHTLLTLITSRVRGRGWREGDEMLSEAEVRKWMLEPKGGDQDTEL